MTYFNEATVSFELHIYCYLWAKVSFLSYSKSLGGKSSSEGASCEWKHKCMQSKKPLRYNLIQHQTKHGRLT